MNASTDSLSAGHDRGSDGEVDVSMLSDTDDLVITSSVDSQEVSEGGEDDPTVDADYDLTGVEIEEEIEGVGDTDG